MKAIGFTQDQRGDLVISTDISANLDLFLS